jgi:cell division protein FtsZ
MYKEGIQDVSFVLCNTDQQALDQSAVPEKVVLGKGLGAGGDPDVARLAAEESADKLEGMLNDGTQMVFITAGMGGGTGTGAAPVIARVAKDMDILTVGIVTIPFIFEGEPKIIQALNGVEEMSKHVDALLVINNERLFEIFGDRTKKEAFAEADNTLTVAARSIAETITLPGIINLDFADVNTTLRNGGVALISVGYGEGEHRVRTAIDDALKSPLLNKNDIFTAKKILFNVLSSPENDLRMSEMKDINDFMSRFNRNINVIWGTADDDTLGDKVKITILASGFGVSDIPEVAQRRKEEEERNRALMEKYYIGTNHTLQVASQHKVVVLTVDELDDNRVISQLEDNPTYKRDKKFVSSIREAAPGTVSGTSAPVGHPSDTSGKSDKNGGKGRPIFSGF